MMFAKSEEGFTLVEVLISLFIFALISAGTMSAMTQTFAAKDRLDQASSELADIAALRAILRADMEALTLRPMRDGVGGTKGFLVGTKNSAEEDAVLTFSRLGRANPSGAARGQAERVRYLFRDGQFIRQSLPHENPAQIDGWRDRVLMAGLEDVKVTYLGPASRNGANTNDFLTEDWLILRTDKSLDDIKWGAVEFRITDVRGNETAHLFELGL